MKGWHTHTHPAAPQFKWQTATPPDIPIGQLGGVTQPGVPMMLVASLRKRLGHLEGALPQCHPPQGRGSRLISSSSSSSIGKNLVPHLDVIYRSTNWIKPIVITLHGSLHCDEAGTEDLIFILLSDTRIPQEKGEAKVPNRTFPAFENCQVIDCKIFHFCHSSSSSS